MFIVREIHSLCCGANRDENVSADVMDEIVRALEKATFELMSVADHIKISCESPTGSEKNL